MRSGNKCYEIKNISIIYVIELAVFLKKKLNNFFKIFQSSIIASILIGKVLNAKKIKDCPCLLSIYAKFKSMPQVKVVFPVARFGKENSLVCKQIKQPGLVRKFS